MTAWLLRALGVLLMLTALAVALSRAPDRPVETLVARWAPAPSDFIEVNGLTVHFRDEGPRDDPLPIVMIHGASDSLHTWEGWTRALKGQRRVLRFDVPGFGLTGPFAGGYKPDDYGGDTYARFLLDLLDALKVPRAVLVGNSLGGEIAWRTAVIAPQRVASLVLVDAIGPPFRPEVMPVGFMMARLPVLSRIGEWLLPRAIVSQSLAETYGDPAKITPELVDRYFELTLREGNRHALGQVMRQRLPGQDVERLQSLKLPTLLLWGAKDRLVPPSVGRDFQQRIAGSQLVVLEGLGHLPQEEDAARSVAPVKQFLGLK